MQTLLKTLLVSSLILITSNGRAEQPMGFNPQGTFLDAGQVPIVWGDCVPVPVAPPVMPPIGLNAGPMPAPSMPAPFAPQFAMPIQGSEPAYIAPPPSPFFNPSPLAALTPPIPAPAPLPMMAPPAPAITVPACDDISKHEIEILQNQYKQAAAASQTNMDEMSLAMQDVQNQLADARIIIEKLSKEQELDRTKIAALTAEKDELDNELKQASSSAEKLTALKQDYDAIYEDNNALKAKLTELENANKTLQSELATLKMASSSQTRKLTVLDQSAAELKSLKSAYKQQNEENISLKQKLAELDNANKTLQSQLGSLKSEAGSQARKLNALSQSTKELAALKSAFKEQNEKLAALEKEKQSIRTKLSSLKTSSALNSTHDKNIIESLKKKLSLLDNDNKTLKTKLASMEANSGSQARKLTALGQTSNELTAIKSAYRALNEKYAALKKENSSIKGKLSSLTTSYTLNSTQDKNMLESLKKKLATLDNQNKTLKSKLATAEASAGSQARKLNALGQSVTELSALKSAYKEQNTENARLKKELLTLKEASGACQSKTEELTNEVAFAKKELNSCQTSTTELQNKLATSEDQRKTLLAKIAALETTVADQARKVTALTATSLELDSLKSAYKELSSKKVELNTKLAEATADTDKDGVLDAVDKCPFSLPGAEVNELGCLADKDKDGVADSKDECPNSPANSQVNEKGCPKITDSDADGVADVQDLCANTAPGTSVNEFGCAPTENITLKGVNFATGSAILTKDSFPILDAAAETLKKNPNIKVEIAGYTDNQGFSLLNKRLSQRRANTVMIYLIEKGVPVEILSAKGYGEKNPVASNNTKEGRATNRRVELKIQ